MVHAFRDIALGSPSRKLRGFERVVSIIARALSVFTVFVFLMDTINVDVLVAAIQGEVRFDDNPLILDSQFDATSVAPQVGPGPNYFQLAKFDGGPTTVHRHLIPKFFGTTIIEDVDSPTVLDGCSTATINYSIRPAYYAVVGTHTTHHPTLDRTITFASLLI